MSHIHVAENCTAASQKLYIGIADAAEMKFVPVDSIVCWGCLILWVSNRT